MWIDTLRTFLFDIGPFPFVVIIIGFVVGITLPIIGYLLDRQPFE